MIHRSGDWLAARVGDELVMMSAVKGNYLGLTEVGARIWELIETPRTLESLCDALVAEYDVDPATCRAEVDAFLVTLGQHDAVRIDPVG
ncbi:MAG: PqqD family peptide modification chaperone [Sphingomonas sp.]|uniref:PqqD family peptide modification chaperone n=1 Tax=Sphingomonas sp. TaxID=28214 RepID=UPI003F80A99A